MTQNSYSSTDASSSISDRLVRALPIRETAIAFVALILVVEPAAVQSAGSAFCGTDMARTIQNIFTLIQFGGPLVGGVLALGSRVVASDRRAVAVVVLAVALVGTAAVAPALAHPENETDHGVDERAFVILWSGDEELAAASVYAACRCNGLPRTLSEIGGVAKVATDRVDHAYNVLNRELGLPAVPTPPVEYVPRPDEIRYRAKTLAEQAVDNGLANGCNSVELAAACVYVAARERGERVIQTDLAELANVTPVTLRARWKDLQPLLDE
jgi:hypothetical protein